MISNRRFMFGSTSRRSLNPIPQGLPGVASSMNRPNSGWKTGSVSPSLLHVSVQEHSALCEHLYLETARNSGTQPPCLLSASSFASASRISAWRKDNLTFRRSSSKATTRYSIYDFHELYGHPKGSLGSPRLPIAERLFLYLWRAARWQEAAATNEFRVVLSNPVTLSNTSIPHCRT